MIADIKPEAADNLTEVKGEINSEDLIADVTVQEERNSLTGVTERVVVEHKQEYHPQIKLLRPTCISVVVFAPMYFCRSH